VGPFLGVRVVRVVCVLLVLSCPCGPGDILRVLFCVLLVLFCPCGLVDIFKFLLRKKE